MSELVLTKLFGIEGGYTVTQTEQTSKDRDDGNDHQKSYQPNAYLQ
jgi:hypothetical protein